jgi:mannose-6-phosphate isomerase
MTPIHPLHNPKKNYAWGSHTALAELLGEPSPSAEPEAELWMGAHPAAASEVEIDGERKGLDRWLEEKGDDWLGADVARAFGGRLPFLFKVLAAEQPLSIQAHPDAEQARQGFEHEEAAGLARDAFERNYKDRSHKPEILYALTPFVILRGFREPAEIVELFRRAGLGPSLPELALLDDGPDGLEPFFRTLLRLEEGRVAGLLDQLRSRPDLLDGLEGEWIARMAEAFPGDRGVLAPLFLLLRRLEPGQAVYTGAGILHAYLDGVGVELMANSDNVLRGGCTRKHVDADELSRIVRFEVAGSGLVEPEPGSRAEHQHFITPADEFRLDRLCFDGRPTVLRSPTVAHSSGEEGAGRTVPGPQVLLWTEGQGRLRALDGDGDDGEGKTLGPELELRKGSSFLVPASVPAFEIEGEGELFRAAVARCPDL